MVSGTRLTYDSLYKKNWAAKKQHVQNSAEKRRPSMLIAYFVYTHSNIGGIWMREWRERIFSYMAVSWLRICLTMYKACWIRWHRRFVSHGCGVVHWVSTVLGLRFHFLFLFMFLLPGWIQTVHIDGWWSEWLCTIMWKLVVVLTIGEMCDTTQVRGRGSKEMQHGWCT